MHSTIHAVCVWATKRAKQLKAMCDWYLIFFFFFFLVKRAGRHFGFFKRAGRHEKGAGRRALQKKPRQNTAWRSLNRLRVQKGRCRAMMKMWKLSHTDVCDCGGETDYVSSYDMCLCPQLHVGGTGYSNPCWHQLCQHWEESIWQSIEDSMKKKNLKGVSPNSNLLWTKAPFTLRNLRRQR